jgi:hypothetical protein
VSVANLDDLIRQGAPIPQPVQQPQEHQVVINRPDGQQALPASVATALGVFQCVDLLNKILEILVDQIISRSPVEQGMPPADFPVDEGVDNDPDDGVV